MSGGVIFGTLFFVLVSFAAWSSAISLAEPIVAWFVEKYKMSRLVAALIIGTAAWLLGLATVFSFNIWSDVKLFDKTIFDLLDFATTNVMLPLGGLLIALFASWTMSKTRMRNEVGIDNTAIFSAWHFTLRFLAPVAIIAVLINGLI
jgi:NSS family neurotransmitter:Na+ symporter